MEQSSDNKEYETLDIFLLNCFRSKPALIQNPIGIPHLNICND